MRLIEIGKDGRPVERLELSETARQVCESMTGMYQEQGYCSPWIGHLAEEDGVIVGTCAFKGPPVDHRVEIAYFTFPEYEGRGIATEMARQLVALARTTAANITLLAQTLPEENASTSVLRKLGFQWVGTVTHPGDGRVWEWQLN
ncbi:MAG TPA: GNAT family N-acetyltransferase [Dehalococcoidia bacterium]|jgi:RimJ/RimL family protein N-acetyltransferase|nr:GNAT family N-acetyltransferase [Dehalococcoidia bacterium]